MFYRIIELIVDVAGGLLVGACLLRLWMQQLRLSAKNPVGQFVMSLTDWLIRPLRRVLPAYANVDWASLVAAYLLSLAAVWLVWLALVITSGLGLGGIGLPELLSALWIALLWMLKWALYMVQLIVLVSAVLSWVNPFSPLLPIFDALTVPLLRPLRRILPPIGRVDLSPLVLLVLIQIALLVVGSQQAFSM